MKKDEKKCASCAEIIKIDALTCRYCGEKFSQQSIDAEKKKRKSAEDRKINNQIDQLLEFWFGTDDFSDSLSLSESDIEYIVSGKRISKAMFVARVKYNKIKVVYTTKEERVEEARKEQERIDRIAEEARLARYQNLRPSSKKIDTQYGVLQGPANVIGGLFTFCVIGFVFLLMLGALISCFHHSG